MLEEALADGFWFVFFPKYTSHYIQPLDDSIFATLKLLFKAKCKETTWQASLFNVDVKALLYDCMLQAEKAVFCNKGIIMNAWAATGMFPYDRKVILENARSNNGVSSLTGWSAEIASDIAQNIKEFVSDTGRELGIKQKRVSVARVSVDGSSGFLAEDVIAENQSKRQKSARKGLDASPSTGASKNTNTEPIAVDIGDKCCALECRANLARLCKMFMCSVCSQRCCKVHHAHHHHTSTMQPLSL